MNLRRNRDGSENNEATLSEITGKYNEYNASNDSDQFPATTGYYDANGNYHEFPSGTHLDTMSWSSN